MDAILYSVLCNERSFSSETDLSPFSLTRIEHVCTSLSFRFNCLALFLVTRVLSPQAPEKAPEKASEKAPDKGPGKAPEKAPQQDLDIKNAQKGIKLSGECFLFLDIVINRLKSYRCHS